MLYSIIRVAEVIDEYIPDERHRQVLRLRLCQNIGYEQIGETVGYSPQWCKDLVKRYKKEILALI